MRALFELHDVSGKNLARRVALGIESRINLTYHYTGEKYVIVLKKLMDHFRAGEIKFDDFLEVARCPFEHFGKTLEYNF